MVVSVGFECCDVMALSGACTVMSTYCVRYRRVPLTQCMNFFPVSFIISGVSGSFVYFYFGAVVWRCVWER